MSSSETAPHEGIQWEYLIVPLRDARGLKKKSDDMKPDHLNDLGSQGWEAVGLSLKSGDLFDWPVVLLKRAKRERSGKEFLPAKTDVEA